MQSIHPVCKLNIYLHQYMRLGFHLQQHMQELQTLKDHLRHIQRDTASEGCDRYPPTQAHTPAGLYRRSATTNSTATATLVRLSDVTPLPVGGETFVSVSVPENPHWHSPSEKMRATGLRVAAVLALFAAVLRSQAEVIDDVLGSLSRGASFLERQHEHINLDGVVGFLMLQVSWAQRSSAVALVKRLDQSLDKAVAALQQNDPKYYKEFEPVLSWSFWLIPQEWSSTDPSLVYSSTMTTECYDEQLSDKCLTLLLGTWYRHTPTQRTTHTLHDRGCTNLLKGDTRASRANITERSYQKIFCSNMMKTNQDIIRDGLTEQTVDIFIENILVCGLAGFSDFYKVDWLQHILRLQDEEVGCFGRDKRIISQIIGDELLEQLQLHRRVKRREKILPGHNQEAAFLNAPTTHPTLLTANDLIKQRLEQSSLVGDGVLADVNVVLFQRLLDDGRDLLTVRYSPCKHLFSYECDQPSCSTHVIVVLLDDGLVEADGLLVFVLHEEHVGYVQLPGHSPAEFSSVLHHLEPAWPPAP
ncbi:hypothetical protein FQN60_004248 [Etheostoma spectabile]|uniref:Uncharacterized protein n=1 Tax=Etheostoma spectabile TaxID=54343 RepID=A0A5J5CWP8_9PERO|nr:hypothetical protein FQN60_004248 [Etheostoma spectabile]